MMRRLILLAGVVIPIMANAQSPGIVVGTTYTARQTMGSTGNRIAIGNDGSVFFAWMKAFSYQRPRHIYFNYLNSEGQWFAPGTGDRVFDDSVSGYCQVAMAYGNRGAIAAHTGANTFSILGIDGDPPGYGIFDHYNIPDLLSNNSRTIWPYIAIDQHNRVHIVMTENWRSPAIERISYARLDFLSGNWWPNATNPELVDTTGWPSVLVAASPVSDKVVIAYSKPIDTTNRIWNDLYYVLSQDGTNWNFINGRINITNYSSDTDSLWANTDLALIFDYNDNFHIAWNANWSSLSNLYYSKTFLFHYSNATQLISQIRTPWPDSQWSGVGCDVGIGNRSICKMDFGVRQADNCLFAIWTQFDTSDCSAGGCANGDIWSANSSDGGMIWSQPENLTNSHTPGCFDGECDNDNWASLADLVDNKMHVFYVNGKYGCEEGGFDNPVLYLDTPAEIVEQAIIPTDFTLFPNYPNPFNSQTSLIFDLVKKSSVRLNIYNMMGEKIACLLEGEQYPGRHKVTWNAGKNPSGVYFAVLKTEKTRQTRQITLIK
jgi:hypothetical protein